MAKVIKRLVLVVSDIVLVLCNLKLCPHFSAGAFGDVEKMNEFGFATSFESFGDVGHNRDAGSANLVNQAEITCKIIALCDFIDSVGQFTIAEL